MNLTVKDGYIKVDCHECSQTLDLGEVIKIGEIGLHCLYCNTHIGYTSDLPDWAKGLVK